MLMKTFSAKPADIEKKWVLIDANGLVVGRLAVDRRACGCAASTSRPTRPHVDDGDNVIIINADKVVLTGRKREQKVYHRHTGFIGGIKERTAKSILEGRFPERVVEKAVERMLPRGPLGRVQLGNLRVYTGAEHPHAAQKPEIARRRRHEPQEQEECLIMAETVQSLDQPSPRSKPAAPEAPKYVQKLDKQGRAYATGKRKNAVARVWIKPGSGKIVVNTRTVEIFFARPVLRMMIQQPLVAANRTSQYDVIVHGFRRRSVGPGWRGAPRHLEGADLFRAGPARRAQAGRLPDPRQPRRRAQEVRPQEGPPVVPVLQALSLVALRLRTPCKSSISAPSWRAFLFGVAEHSIQF